MQAASLRASALWETCLVFEDVGRTPAAVERLISALRVVWGGHLLGR